jgi:hypothetical protein
MFSKPYVLAHESAIYKRILHFCTEQLNSRRGFPCQLGVQGRI